MKLRELRKMSSLTQQQLADLIGVGQSTITLYEKKMRMPKIITICKIAKALNVSEQEVLDCFKN